MVFSSPIFLFGFLPLVLVLYYLSPRVLRNGLLLLASLLFYAWGEVFYVAIMLLSIAANYVVGLVIGRALRRGGDEGSGAIPAARSALILGVGLNLLLLGTFKYANFISENLNVLTTFVGLGQVILPPVHLPLGISFFTFQAISYLVDVYRREVAAQRSLVNLALYISLFPQLIAGPIVRYHDIAGQIYGRSHDVALFANGVRRFVFGLSKKMLVANPLGEVADNVFFLSGSDLTMPLAWIGVLCFSLQIYFDFSGYSDMAIGLGKMFGFEFRENFNYPYVSRSVREFWRRWHISLSTWFRDYVYIPLGGSKVATPKVFRNLFLVFILTGVWHGASWNFVVWGLFHGLFLASEHFGFSQALERIWRPLQHAYLLLVVLFSWVFFRADSLAEALGYCGAMLGLQGWATTMFQYQQVLVDATWFALPLGCILATPVYKWAVGRLSAYTGCSPLRELFLRRVPETLLLGALLFLCAVDMSANTYNPFIYFRF